MNKDIWMEVDGDITVIGLTPELQEEAGDIAYASIAEEGEIDVDDTLLNVEASKATIEVPSPISGQIIARNTEAEDQPSLLNSLDRAENWIVKIKG